MNNEDQKPTIGRPREHNREQIAIDMVEWAKKHDSINLCKFCALYNPPIPPSKISNWAKEDDSFRQAYESAKLFLGFRREEMLNNETLHVKAYDLNATVYDYFLKEERQAQMKYQSELNMQEAKSYTQDDVNRIDSLKEQIKQSRQSQRNIADNNANPA